MQTNNKTCGSSSTPLFISNLKSNDLNTKKKLYSYLENLKLGKIKSIILKRAFKSDYYYAIVNLNYWFKNENAVSFREKIEEGRELKIIYSYPWYWKVTKFKCQNTNVKKTVVNNVIKKGYYYDAIDKNTKQIISQTPLCSPPRSPSVSPPRSPLSVMPIIKSNITEYSNTIKDTEPWDTDMENWL